MQSEGLMLRLKSGGQCVGFSVRECTLRNVVDFGLIRTEFGAVLLVSDKEELKFLEEVSHGELEITVLRNSEQSCYYGVLADMRIDPEDDEIAVYIKFEAREKPEEPPPVIEPEFEQEFEHTLPVFEPEAF